jgi:hypothetical protein
MRKILFVAFLMMLVPLAVLAQSNYPKAEVFGGYSHFRANPSEFDHLYNWKDLNGWNASFAGNINKWFGIEGDFDGYYGSPSILDFNIPLLHVSYYTFMGGPKLTYRSGAVAPFTHFLIGAARGSIGGGIGSFNLTLTDQTALAAAVGGGIDINMSKHFAIRPVQADYLMTRFNPITEFPFSGLSERQNNLRLSAGIVFRF